MSITLKYNLVKIRKPHHCNACLSKFEPKTEMFYYFVVDGGDYGSGYVCRTCDKILKHWQRFDNRYEWELGEVYNSLDKCQTPEEYLNKMESMIKK